MKDAVSPPMPRGAVTLSSAPTAVSTALVIAASYEFSLVTSLEGVRLMGCTA